MYIENLAVTPERPSLSRYGIPALWLFKSFDRDSYLATFGEQAPPFDLTRPIQQWLDTDPTVDIKDYTMSAVDSGTQRFEEYAVPFTERFRPNLPGLYEYPKLVHSPTAAYQSMPGGRKEPLNPARLIVRSGALQLCDETGGTHISVDVKPAFPNYFPPTEERRPFIIHYDDRPVVSACLLRDLQATRGVGHPGHWDLSDKDNMQWVVQHQSQPGMDHPVLEVPCRLLYDDEEVVKGFGGSWWVQAVVAKVVNFTAEDRELLLENMRLIDDLGTEMSLNAEAIVDLLGFEDDLSSRLTKLEERVANLEFKVINTPTTTTAILPQKPLSDYSPF